MNKTELKKRLEFLSIVDYRLKRPIRQKTLRSLIRDFNKPIPDHYYTIRDIYYAIKEGYQTKLSISVKLVGHPFLFSHTSYNLQYLLLRGLIDRTKRGNTHYYFVTGKKLCGFNAKYQYLLYKRW